MTNFLASRKSTRKISRVERFLRREKWFGVPRWIIAGLVVGVLVCVDVYGELPKASPQVRSVIEGLRHSSVYVAPGAPGKVDPERAKQVLGDRPIVVALLDDNQLPPSGRSLVTAGQHICKQIAELVPTTIVIVFGRDEKRGYDSSFCTGPDFSNAENPVPADNYDFVLIAAAETGWKYRVSEDDLTPKIEEYVLAFDAQAAKDYPQSVPRRAAVPDELATRDIVFSLGGIVAGCVALFFLLHLLARFLGRRSRRGRARLEMGARLSKIGEYVMSADPQRGGQAEVARGYVVALAAYESGEDVEPQVKELERLMA